jgi:hypothetical protein
MINWSEEEDIELKRLVHTYGEKSFHRICKQMPYNLNTPKSNNLNMEDKKLDFKTEIRCHN